MKISLVSTYSKWIVHSTYDGFYNELLNKIVCPIEQKEIGIPIQCNEKTKENVEKYLKSLNFGNRINSISAFFKKIPNDECYYIIPIELDEDAMDELKERIKYYNEKYDHEYVKKKIKPFCDHIKEIKEFAKFNYDNYIQKYHTYVKIEKLGETDRKQRECIYCGKKQNDGATFRQVAHAIPEALGNKMIIQNEECDNCNAEFGKGIEKEFIEFIGMIRTIGGIRGKGNEVPTYKFKDISIFYEKTAEEGGMLKIDVPNTSNVNIIEDISPIRNEDLYRFLCKMVVGVIDQNYRANLTSTIHWIRYGQVQGMNREKYELPKIAVRIEEDIIKEPEIATFIRNNDDKNIPYCFAEFRVANLIFVYILPFVEKDNGFISEDSFEKFWNKTIYKNFEFEFTSQYNNEKFYFGKIVPINIDGYKELNKLD